MIWTLIVGFVVGLLARAIKPGADSMGWILTIVLGIAGLFGMSANQGFGYLVFSVIGAIIILFIYELLTGKRRRL